MTKRFKIEPDLTCPELAGYKLPEVEQRQEDDVVAMAKEEYEQAVKRKGQEYAGGYYEGTIDGYNKAREKFEFTEDDMKYIFECGRNYQNNAEVTFKVSIDHLRTPRTPIAIEVEMEYYYMSSVKLYGKDAGWVKCDKIQFDGIKESIPTCPLKEIPAINPDGTVKGVYVYE